MKKGLDQAEIGAHQLQRLVKLLRVRGGPPVRGVACLVVQRAHLLVLVLDNDGAQRVFRRIDSFICRLQLSLLEHALAVFVELDEASWCGACGLRLLCLSRPLRHLNCSIDRLLRLLFSLSFALALNFIDCKDARLGVRDDFGDRPVLRLRLHNFALFLGESLFRRHGERACFFTCRSLRLAP